MADIYEFVKKSDNSRPLYTSYELSQMIRDQRASEGLSAAEFASKYGVPAETLIQIEECRCSFSPKLYKMCGQILNLTSEQLLLVISDDTAAANFRSNGNDDNVQKTFHMANMLFNEIIMQKKIGIGR